MPFSTMRQQTQLFARPKYTRCANMSIQNNQAEDAYCSIPRAGQIPCFGFLRCR